MLHQEPIRCTVCQDKDLVKNGRSRNGTQRWRCLNCGKSFQRSYTYKAHQPGIKEQIDQQTLNSSGVRDIARNLGISPNTVCNHLKKVARSSEPVSGRSARGPATQ